MNFGQTTPCPCDDSNNALQIVIGNFRFRYRFRSITNYKEKFIYFDNYIVRGRFELEDQLRDRHWNWHLKKIQFWNFKSIFFTLIMKKNSAAFTFMLSQTDYIYQIYNIFFFFHKAPFGPIRVHKSVITFISSPVIIMYFFVLFLESISQLKLFSERYLLEGSLAISLNIPTCLLLRRTWNIRLD